MGTLGVIFTDTCVLADKYNCRQEEVLQLIRAFICGSEGQGVEWQLVDVGGHDFDYILQKDDTWRGYCKALNDNCIGMGWKTDCNTPLLIIGGDDVIPLPVETIMQKNLQVDLYYCYPCDFQMRREIDMAKKKVASSVYDVMMSKALFNVSRLPLESEKRMKTTLQEDLGRYFSRSVETGGSIMVEYMLPISAYDWYMSVRYITEGIPLVPLGHDTPYWMSDIFISPCLALEKQNNGGLEELLNALNKADMLMFNTHGSDVRECSGFNGQGPGEVLTLQFRDEEHDRRVDKEVYDKEMPCAFDVPLLPYSKARILNTLACYGARFVNYERSQSMLLSALYGNYLLYMGSCELAYGRGGYRDENNVIRPTGYAETLMKEYVNLLIEGEPAGLALLKAKWRYYNNCCVEEDGAKDGLATYTILEFNQFGNPALRVNCPNYEQQVCTSTIAGSMRNDTSFSRDYLRNYTASLSNGFASLDDLYSDVRNTLDKALSQLSEELCEMLEKDYCYSKNDLLLKQVVRIDEPRNWGDKLFHYDYGRVKNGEHIVIVHVDRYGRPKDVIHTI